MLTVVPRLVAMLTRRGFGIPTAADWAETRVVVPAPLAGRYRSVFTGEEIEPHTDGGELSIPLERLLGEFPVALLERI